MSLQLTPGRALMLLGVGHAGWGAVAYRDVLRDLAGSGFVGAVGDGNFVTAQSRGPRAAAFWFMAATPLIVLVGYHVEAATKAGDRKTVGVTGWALLAMGATGAAAMPRSGFWAALPIAYRLIRFEGSGRR